MPFVCTTYRCWMTQTKTIYLLLTLLRFCGGIHRHLFHSKNICPSSSFLRGGSIYFLNETSACGGIHVAHLFNFMCCVVFFVLYVCVLCLVCLMFAVSLDCLLLIEPSVLHCIGCFFISHVT